MQNIFNLGINCTNLRILSIQMIYRVLPEEKFYTGLFIQELNVNVSVVNVSYTCFTH